MSPHWLSAFLDFAPEHFEEGVAFWSRLTSYDVSGRRGAEGQFATLVPPDGADFLRVQRLGDGLDRIHLDLHVTDVRAAADRAAGLGATEVADRGYVAMRSPGGLAFCFVDHQGGARPRPTTWRGGHVSVLDQVCIDIPEEHFDAECGFWAELTGWALGSFRDDTEFRHLVRAPEQPIRLLLQRLEEPTGPVRAHLDWSTTDRAAETLRHEAVGAQVLDRRDGWTVLSDPFGRRYCITDRDPGTGARPDDRSR